ncbi:hypothetical protein L1887_54396 [Cichorium endivia]|nr:hypothetical protein L1887_54396 [Cichorium endivia]
MSSTARANRGARCAASDALLLSETNTSRLGRASSLSGTTLRPTAFSYYNAPFLHLALPCCWWALQNAVISERLQHAPPSLFPSGVRGSLVVLARVRQTSARSRSGNQYETGAANVNSLCSKDPQSVWQKTSASSGVAAILYFRLESPPFESRKITRLNTWTEPQILMTKPYRAIT